ncbi:Separin, partial [Trametes pubescens]
MTGPVDKLREASSAIKRCGPSLGQSGEDRDRVKRGGERLRRAVVKIIEPSASAETNCPPELHQGGRLAHAVPFLEQACARAEDALGEWRPAVREEREGADAKTGDLQMAYDAFVKSIAAFPYALHGVAALAATTLPSALFDGAPPLKHLVGLVDRVTYMAACKLFRAPASVPVAAWPRFACPDGVVGALMERQLAGLEGCRWKAGVRAVMDAILDSVAGLYEREGCVVRCASVLVRKLKLRYHCEEGCECEGGDGWYEEMKRLREFESLLSVENIEQGPDKALARYAPELRAAAHLWLAAHAHCARDPALAAVLVAHVEDACRVLKGMVPVAVPKLSVAGKEKVVEEKGRRGVRTTRVVAGSKAAGEAVKGRVPAGRTRAAKTAVAVTPPVTPKRRRALGPVSLNTAVISPPRNSLPVPGVQGKMEFDDFAKHVDLIRMVSHLVGLLGHVLARVQLLNAARRLTERHTGVASEVYVSLTIDTAHQYVKLGRAEKAVSVLAHVLPAIRSGTLSQEGVIVFLLRYAEAQVAMGEVLKASLTYCEVVATAADFVIDEKGLPTAQRIRVRTALLERAAEAALAYAAIQDARARRPDVITRRPPPGPPLMEPRDRHSLAPAVSRLPSTAPKPAAEDNPFEVPKPANTAQAVAQLQEPRVLSPNASCAPSALDSASWRLAEGLLSTLLALAQAYAARGSAREAEFFAHDHPDGSGDTALSPASQDMLETLATAESCSGNIWATSLVGDMSRLFTPVLAAQLLDASTVTTLRREMLDVIRHKFLNLNAMDDMQWPHITPNGSPLPAQPKSRPAARFSSILSDSEDDEPMDDVDLKAYWQAIAKRYEAQSFDMAKMSVNQADQLPLHWTVVNVSITEDRHTMFVTRQRAGHKPLIFCLPLKGRREGQEDEHLTYEDAIKELQEIIRLSDEGTRQAADVKKDDREARMAWWKTRSELDGRLRELLGDIEFCWLGAFKTIFTPTDLHSDDLAALRTRLDVVFKGSLVFQEKKPKSRLGLDDGLLECFSTLPPNCREEELEDLVYFILDLYQFHGVPVAISEVDMDQVVVELRNALEEHAARIKGRVGQDGDGDAAGEKDDGHIFLVLDKNVQGIPWESLPVLRGKSVSRIPSMDFLIDRLEFSHWRKWEDGRAQEGLVDQASVDPRRTYFVLNPSGDLKGTEGRFAEWLTGMKSVGWDGVVGHAPSEQQFVDALTNRDLV